MRRTHEWVHGRWRRVAETNPHLPNYVIVCGLGGWSGFRPLYAKRLAHTPIPRGGMATVSSRLRSGDDDDA